MEYGITDILRLLGALGLFLFGMKVMSDSLLKLAGNRMRTILASMTSNRFLGITTGFLITSVIQSSSATTLMVVSFSNASLLTLPEAISVIMGANIGTTVTAWIIAILGFKVSMSSIALPLVGLGVLFTFSKKDRMQNWGSFIVGFAVLFIGLQFLKESLPDIQQHPEILEFLQRYTEGGFASVILFMMIGTVLTILIQSSSATMALTLLMTAEGWIPFEMAAAMVLGENIGTTITANIAAIVANYQARRTARAHLIFNLLGVVWMLVLFYPFIRLIDWLTQLLGSPSPLVQMAAVPVAISLFHTVFNFANTFLLVWFVKPISWIVQKVVPEVILPEKTIEEPKFLKKDMLKYPETAIATLEKETDYLFRNAIFEIVTHALNIHRQDVLSDEKSKKVVKKSVTDFKTDVRALYLAKVKTIYGEIIRFATQIQTRHALTVLQNKRVTQIRVANRRMVEIIRDVTDLNRNVSLYLESENEHVKKQYNNFRRIVVKALRVIYPISPVTDKLQFHTELQALEKDTHSRLEKGNVKIDSLIRHDEITTDMASSLVNDQDHVRDLIDKLIIVADILYASRDPLIAENPVQEDISAEQPVL